MGSHHFPRRHHERAEDSQRGHHRRGHAWPGVEAGYGKRGEWGFRVNGHEVGHLHGDHAAHFSFGKEVGAALREQGRVVDHPVFPGKNAMAARRIDSDEDVRDVIELMRLNYDRIVARYGLSREMDHAA